MMNRTTRAASPPSTQNKVSGDSDEKRGTRTKLLTKMRTRRKSMISHGTRADEGLKGVFRGKCSLCMDNHEEIGRIRVSEKSSTAGYPDLCLMQDI
jgi:hypothetical protein